MDQRHSEHGHRPCRAGIALPLGLCALLSGATAPAAEIYKWIDEDGRVHFGDRPQASDAESITVKALPAPGSGAGVRHERMRKLLESYASERQERQDNRAAAQAEAAERKRKCAGARAEQQRREHSAFLFYRDADGNRRIIEGEEYDAAIQAARDAVTEWCG